MVSGPLRDLLNGINAVVGVRGSLVCDPDGQVVASAMPTVYDEFMLTLVGRTATQTVAGLKTTSRRTPGDLDLVYSDARFIVKNLRTGCLCILCMPHINVPLLNLTANVAARKLQTGLLQPSTADRPSKSLTKIDRLRNVAEQVLAEHASRVLPMLSGAEGSVEELLEACARMERATRLFIDSQKAQELGQRLRDIIQE
jgi:predicted regulator of Ras-like GTPase activity (Roadblock/LC7/MglB family)